MKSYATTLFEEIDGILDASAHRLRDAVASQYRDFPWAHQQYQELQPLIRRELETVLFHLLGTLDNVGGVLPQDAKLFGYRIKALPYEDGQHDGLPTYHDLIEVDIHDGNLDYQQMWLAYRNQKLADNKLSY